MPRRDCAGLLGHKCKPCGHLLAFRHFAAQRIVANFAERTIIERRPHDSTGSVIGVAGRAHLRKIVLANCSIKRNCNQVELVRPNRFNDCLQLFSQHLSVL